MFELCAGTYGCSGTWAGTITRDIMLRGFEALIDCKGEGGVFKIGYGHAVGQVSITGFDIHNAIGNAENDGYAGGVDATNVKRISVLSSTFTNCTGREAGAIAVRSSKGAGENNIRNLQNLTIRDSARSSSIPRVAGGAGSISLSYDSDYNNNHNNNMLSNIQISNSSGGRHTNEGGAAGSISLSYSGYNNNNNSNRLSNIQISNSSGGSHTSGGGAAGSISLSYKSNYNSNHNSNMLSNIQISNSSGGSHTSGGGAAGSISLSYDSTWNSNHNSNMLSNIQISNS